MWLTQLHFWQYVLRESFVPLFFIAKMTYTVNKNPYKVETPLSDFSLGTSLLYVLSNHPDLESPDLVTTSIFGPKYHEIHVY